MIRSQTLIEIKIADRTYVLGCAPDSPLGELCDALTQMRQIVVDKIVQSTKAEVPHDDDGE